MMLYSLAARLVVVESPEMTVTNPGLYLHHQSNVAIQLEVCYHLVEKLHLL